MFKNLKDKIALSGITVLAIGVALLIFTFFSAYGFLTTDLSPISTQDLVQTFGESLGPLIAAAIHIMYLGVMGWVSSLITRNDRYSAGRNGNTTASAAKN